MDNFKIEIFRQQLIKTISNADLPIGVIRLILKDIFSQIDVLYENCLNKEKYQLKKQQQQQSQQKKKKEKQIKTKQNQTQVKNDSIQNNTIIIDDTLVSWEEGKVD